MIFSMFENWVPQYKISDSISNFYLFRNCWLLRFKLLQHLHVLFIIALNLFLLGAMVVMGLSTIISAVFFYVIFILFIIFVMIMQYVFILHYTIIKKNLIAFIEITNRINNSNESLFLPQLQDYMAEFTFEQQYYLFGELSFRFQSSYCGNSGAV